MFKMKKELKQLNELERLSSKMRLAAESWDEKWKTLIAIILSARSRDETTILVAEKLFDKYNTLESLANSKLSSIQTIIRSVNFYKNKSKNILNCAKILINDYKGKIPETIEELIKLPGVGRKTANVFLAEYGGDTIGVDTHVSYVSQKLNWTKNKNPEKIEKDLERLFQKIYWRKINQTLVLFGKTYTRKKEKDKILEKIKNLT